MSPSGGGVLRTLRIWLALCCSVALVVALAVGVTAQVAPGNPFATDGFVDASGGSGGSARGGDGGRGGTGIGPMCSQNTNDVFETDWWEGDSEPTVACGAGGIGGDAGAAGESIGGNGGIAFGVGPPPPPTTTTTTTTPRRRLADLFVRQRAGSFIITVGNNGPDPLQAAHLLSTFSGDFGASFDSVETTKGTCTGPGMFTSLSTPQTVTCDFGDLAVGELVTVTIAWFPGECGSTAQNTAVVSDAGPDDPDLTNNSSELSEHRGAFGC